MHQHIHEFVPTCDLCQRNKSTNQVPPGLLPSLSTSEGLWESISMDLVTKLPQTAKDNTAIVVFVDRLSKMIRSAAVQVSI